MFFICKSIECWVKNECSVNTIIKLLGNNHLWSEPLIALLLTFWPLLDPYPNSGSVIGKVSTPNYFEFAMLYVLTGTCWVIVQPLLQSWCGKSIFFVQAYLYTISLDTHIQTYLYVPQLLHRNKKVYYTVYNWEKENVYSSGKIYYHSNINEVDVSLWLLTLFQTK